MKYLLFLSVILLYSCTYSNDTKENQIQKTIANTSLDEFAHVDSSFYEFLINFGFNESLQKNRIKFPLEYEEAGIKSFLASNTWKHDRLFVDLEAITEISDGLEEKGEASEKIFSWVNTQTLFSRNYYFKKQKGKWRLVKVALIKEKVYDNGENFYSFLGKFCKDSIFQKQRINYPLDMTTLDNDYNEKREYIKSDKWRFSSFYYGCDSISNLYNSFNPSFSTPNKRILLIHGVENGINAQFTFKKISGKWLLVKYEDYST